MTTILDEKGDLNAPPGSPAWAIAIRLRLQYLVHQAQTTDEIIDPLLDKLEETEAYRQLSNEKGLPFKNPIEFYEAKYPYGLGGAAPLKTRIAKAKQRVMAAASDDEVGDVLPRGNPTGANQYKNDTGENTNLVISSIEHRAKRNSISKDTQRKLDHIARFRPDLLECVKGGELSADRAYKLARDIKDPTTLDKLQKLWQQAAHHEKVAFLSWIETL